MSALAGKICTGCPRRRDAGQPVRELFAGVYQQAEQAVAARAKILSFRKLRKTDARKQETIIQLAQIASVNPANE